MRSSGLLRLVMMVPPMMMMVVVVTVMSMAAVVMVMMPVAVVIVVAMMAMVVVMVMAIAMPMTVARERQAGRDRSGQDARQRNGEPECFTSHTKPRVAVFPVSVCRHDLRRKRLGAPYGCLRSDQQELSSRSWRVQHCRGQHIM